jgi:N-[(2S)-2-amino-2-carboxyethyl]-L-glutamate dehydrogenase
MSLWPDISSMSVCDLDPARASRFAQKCQELFAGVEAEVAPDVQTVFSRASLISMATTAAKPYVFDLPESTPASVLLHISLRDLAPRVILSCDNIVDDVDHVCRAQTSIHLTEQQVGHREFIRCTLADITRKAAPARTDASNLAVFSPFGLGVLDLAVAQFVYELALSQGKGTVLDSFLVAPWDEESGRRGAAGT